MNISGKKINELDSIVPTLQTVLPAVRINGTEVSDTAGRISLQDIKSLIGGGGSGGAPEVTYYDNNTGTSLNIIDVAGASLVKVYKNGVLLRPGTEHDYSITGSSITFSVALETTDNICVEVF